VKFGSSSVVVLSDNGTTITATCPSGSLGLVDVTLVAGGGTSAINQPADEFHYITPPTAATASYIAPQGSPLTVTAPGVLAADTDPQGYTLTAAVVTNPGHGILSLNSNGSFTYTPTLGYLGPDSFTYTASDGYATSSPATVSITVGPATLVWTGTLLGDWTDAEWSGASLMTYPDGTANAVVQTPHVVQTTAPQTAYALAISNGGQVAVAAGSSLTVTTYTSVTGNGVLNVSATGAFSTASVLTVDSGGSVLGGSVSAAAYQFNAGTVSANLSGPGSLAKSTGGTVVLSGVDSYTGGTIVNDGTLIVANASALPNGTSLTVGAGGIFVFGPSQTASSVSAAGLAAPAAGTSAVSKASTPIVTASARVEVPVTASPLSIVSPFLGKQVKNPPYVPVTAPVAKAAPTPATPPTMSRASIDAVFATHRSAFDQTVPPADIVQPAFPWACLAALETSWNTADYNQKTDSNVEALDKVLARFGV